MSALGTSAIAFVVILSGAAGGASLRKFLPEQHLSDDTKDIVRLGTGLIGTIAALVLGLLIAAANSTYGTETGHVQHMAADLIMLDQVLAQYGDEATPARAKLRETVPPLVERIWYENRSAAPHQATFEATRSGQDAAAIILHLAPQNDAQRAIRDRAIQITSDLAQTRFLLFEQSSRAIPFPFLVVLIFWLSIIFAGFAMFSKLNLVSGLALIVFAVSAAGALFLVLELSDPFAGLMQIPKEPLRQALAPI
jgi:Protein of unknown function (DUF4239)